MSHQQRINRVLKALQEGTKRVRENPTLENYRNSMVKTPERLSPPESLRLWLIWNSQSNQWIINGSKILS